MTVADRARAGWEKGRRASVSTRILAGGLAALLAAAGWFGWTWTNGPSPPDIALDRLEPTVAQAVSAALAKVRAGPRSGTAWGELAMVLAANGLDSAAVDCFVYAERYDPADPRWPYLHAHQLLLHGDPARAFPCLRRALELRGTASQRAEILFRLALAQLEDGELGEAEASLQSLQAVEPRSARLRFGQGVLAVARDDRAAARTQLTPLIDDPFTRKRACAFLAALAMADGDLELAAIYERRASAAPPDLGWPDHHMLAEQQRYDVNRRDRSARLESLEQQGQLDELLVGLRELAAEKGDTRSTFALANVLAKLGKLEEAEEVLNRLLRLEPKNVPATYTLATILLLRGEKALSESGQRTRARELFEQAVAAADRVLVLRPDYAFAYATRGRGLKHLGRNDEALAALREAVACRPEFADTHMHLGEALAEMGRFPEALRCLEDAVRLAPPGDEHARQTLERWQTKARSVTTP